MIKGATNRNTVTVLIGNRLNGSGDGLFIVIVKQLGENLTGVKNTVSRTLNGRYLSRDFNR